MLNEKILNLHLEYLMKFEKLNEQERGVFTNYMEHLGAPIAVVDVEIPKHAIRPASINLVDKKGRPI